MAVDDYNDSAPVRWIGVTSPYVRVPSKRDALFFDQIGFVALSENLRRLPAERVAELEYLVDNAVVFDATFKTHDLQAVTIVELEAALHDALIANVFHLIVRRDADPSTFDTRYFKTAALSLKRGSVDAEKVGAQAAVTFLAEIEALARNTDGEVRSFPKRLEELEIQAVEINTRLICQEIAAVQSAEVRPLLKSGGSASKRLPDTNAVVCDIALTRFPVATQDTPWEQILEFRNGEDAGRARRRLRRWVRQLSAKQQEPREIAQELEFLLDEYESYMKLHRMKIEHSSLETVLVSCAELVENVAKLNFSKAAKALFIARNRKIALLEAERTAPGREVAYIAQASSVFK